ncbi:MAG TPA: LacI family DNA-binding transcriptional regulator [Ktedonobacteraceae bacterium]|nr:LacI family DNA-binding transcriptional regulator [Ktedonobacteraceae bacterium]
MATIQDVARAAGVSISTVSHVLNNTRFVQPETRERVESAIRRLGYQPNAVARSLRRRTTNTIAMIVPDSANPFLAELARSVEDAAFAEGYNMILCNSAASVEREEACIRMLLSKQMDGFIFVPLSRDPERLRLLLDAEVPVVILRDLAGAVPVDAVLTDNEQGGYLAGHYLLQLGHRRIGFLSGPRDSMLSEQRLAGFRRALCEGGVELSDELTLFGDFRYDSGQSAMVQLLQSASPPSAVFVTSDLMAIGALQALHHAHLRAPQDISLVGFDNIFLSSLVSPPLTTIAQPIQEIGQQAIAALLRRIQEPALAPFRLLLPSQLVERESCRAVVPEREEEYNKR